MKKNSPLESSLTKFSQTPSTLDVLTFILTHCLFRSDQTNSTSWTLIQKVPEIWAFLFPLAKCCCNVFQLVLKNAQVVESRQAAVTIAQCSLHS